MQEPIAIFTSIPNMEVHRIHSDYLSYIVPNIRKSNFSTKALSQKIGLLPFSRLKMPFVLFIVKLCIYFVTIPLRKNLSLPKLL